MRLPSRYSSDRRRKPPATTGGSLERGASAEISRPPLALCVGTGAPVRGAAEIVKKLYVGNLPFSATENEVESLFGQHGTVHSVALINDRETGRPRGFGFVEMDDEAATAAMGALDGADMGGRPLRVNEAQPRGGGGGGGGRRF